MFNEPGCRKCPWRFNKLAYGTVASVCVDCQNFLGQAKIWDQKFLTSKKTGKKTSYIGLPNGDPDWLESTFDIELDNVVDRRSSAPFRNKKLKFLLTLYEGQEVNGVKTVNQARIVKEVLEKDCNGIVLSPTRSGKTVMGLYLSIKLGLRTLILASKIDWLVQFEKTLYRCSNVAKLQADYDEQGVKRKIIGIVRKTEDFDTIDNIVLCTPQMLYSSLGKERLLKYIKGQFGFLLVDEVHKAAARAFNDTIFRGADMRHKAGLSATPERKDGLDWITKKVIGGVIAKGESVGLKPEVFIVRTNLKPKKEPSQYMSIMKWLSDNHERNKILVKLVFKLLREKATSCILLPVVKPDHAKLLTEMINNQAKYNNDNKGESWSENLALAFHGGSKKRETILDTYRAGAKGGTRVAIVMRQMCTEALDVGAWDILISSFLFANPPQTFQLSSRVLTPVPGGNKNPKIYLVVDDLGLTLGCFRSTWAEMRSRKYIISQETNQVAKGLLEFNKASW